jgi:amino acid transporter
LPRSLGKVHKKHGSPIAAAASFTVACILGIIIPALAGMAPLRVYAAFAAIGSVLLLLLMFATSISVIVYFPISKEHTATLWQSLIAPALAMVGLGAVLYLAVTNRTSIIGSTRAAANTALVAIVVIAAAGAALAAVYRTRRPAVYAKIGRQGI